MNSLDFVIELATHVVDHLDRYTQAGHNGPYYHPETPLRNKGHWLFTFARAYQWTGDQKFKQAAEPLAEYLISDKARPNGYAFYHRNKEGKDKSNGLVGQAWTIESLIEAAKLFDDANFTNLAKEVFLAHNFIPKYGLWNILEVDGKHKPIDYAFNHQLWFAASGSLILSEDKLIRENVETFLNALLDNVTLQETGLIYHELEQLYDDTYQPKVKPVNNFKNQAISLLETIGLRKSSKVKYGSLEEKRKVLWDKMKQKSIGYHAFNTYAFAILKESLPNHELWKTLALKKISAYLLTEEYNQGIKSNKYSFAYNPPGFEVPFSLLKLLETDETVILDRSQALLNQQIKMTYNSENFIFEKHTEDPYTLTARIYELTRVPVSTLEKLKIN